MTALRGRERLVTFPRCGRASARSGGRESRRRAFRVVAEMVSYAGVESGGGDDAAGGLGFERGGAGDLGNAAVVLLGGSVLEIVEQSGDLGAEGRREAGVDEGSLDGWRSARGSCGFAADGRWGECRGARSRGCGRCG